MTFCSVCVWKREWRTCMCVCSLNCCSVAIVTTFPISLLIQTGLKLRLVAALLPHYHRPKHELSPSSPPALTPHAHAQPAVWTKHPPLSPGPVLTPPFTFDSFHSCDVSSLILNILMVEDWSVFSTLFKTGANLETIIILLNINQSHTIISDLPLAPVI